MKVLVKHATKTDKNEKVSVVNAKPALYDVVATYEDGSIRTNTGDVWVVKAAEQGAKHNGKAYHFVSVK